MPVLTKGKGMDIADPEVPGTSATTRPQLVTELKPDAVVVSESNEYNELDPA